MKRNVKISKIGTSMIAGVMIANNIPAITVSAEENTENAIISNSSTDNSQEITGGISSSPDLDGENKVEEGEEIAGAEIEAIPNEPTDIKEGVTEAGNSENVSDVSRNATITETNVTINRDNIELNADLEVKSGEINFNFDPFTLTGENNPTKERVEKALDAERYTNADNLTTAGIGDVDANGDGYYDLSEKLDFEIKYSIRKTLENLGKNTENITYKNYTLDTTGIDDNTEIEMSDSLKTAVKEVLGISDDSELTYGRLKTETSLDLSNKNITDLSGIEYFTNLESLDLSNNQINSSDNSNLKSLLTLKNLKTLDLSNNQITTFGQEELANLTKLESVDLSNNQITVLQNINLKDSDNATLKSINLQGNRIATIQNVRIDNLESLNVLLNDIVTIENLYLPSATSFLINTNVLQKFRYVNLDSLSSLDLTIKSNYATPVIEMVSLKNAYRFYVTPPTARQTSRPNPDPVDGVITEDKTTPYSKFQYIDAPNVTEMNPSFNFAAVKYFNLEKYTGEISINTSTSDNTVDISNFNIPLATTFDFITPRQDKTYEQTSYLLENVNANSLTTFSNTEKIALSSMRHIYKNLSINSISEITRKGYTSGYAKGFFNISGENLTYLVTNNGEIGDKFNKAEFGVQGCYFPSVLEIVESGMIEQEDKQPEFIYENTNLDSLEETMVSSLGTYDNSIRISTVSNLSVRNIGNIFADREETELFVEPFTLKGLIAPSAKTLFIANKNNFETLDDIINLPALEEITLLNTGISDISVLQNLDANQIKSLNLKGSKVADIGPIANLGNKLKSIDTTEQRVDYTAYKEADNSVKLVNVINDSSGELIKENSIKITGISNGGIYDADTNSISWENTDNSINAGDTLTFKFSSNYEINGIEFEYSGTGTVNVDESANKPVSLQYDVQIVGANNQRVNYSQVDDFNTKLEEGVNLTGKDAGDFKLKVEGAVEKPVGGRKAVSKITYKAVKNDDESIVAAEKVRQIVVSNMDPVLNGINTSVYWKLGDEEIDFAQGITATDEEDGDIDVSKIKITKDFDFKDITDETKRTGKVTYSVTDSDGNTVTKTTTVYINYKGVKISEDLKVAVNKALGRNKKTEVLQEDLEKVTSINLDNTTDLAGLEYLINLESLSISGATVEEGFTLDLNKFPKLKYLYANNIKNLDNNFVKAFNGNTVLEHLEISGENKIEAFTDVNLPNLTRLKIGNISEFDRNLLPKLQHFSLLENNKLRRLNLDSNLNTLEELYFTGYNGSFTINADFISKFKNLKKLGLQNTDIDITGINLSNLTSLDLPRMELIENLNLPNLTEFNADFSIVTKFNNNILPNLTSFSITAPELVEFSGNDFSNVTSFSHNLPKVEKFNNNKFPKIELLKFSPSFQVLTEFCGNDFRGVKSFNSFSLPYIKKFNGNNFSGFKDGFTLSVANGAGSLEEFCNNDFSGLLSSKKFQIGDSNGAGNYYDLSNLKRIVGNNFGNVGRINIWSANSQEDVDIYEKEFKDNIFGSGTHTISMSGSFGTLQISSNTLRNLWLNRGTFGVIKDLDLPKVTDFSIINATIDEMINVNLPNATIFNLGSNKPIIRKMINVNIPKIGNLQLGTADNPMELLQDCTVKWLNTSYIKEIVNLSQTEPNLGLNVHLANTGIERFTIGSATFTNDYGLHNNKIRDIDELAKSVKDKSNAIDADINITIYGQKPEINIYTDEDSKVLTFDEIFKASDAATEAGNDLTYTVTSITKGDGTTVSNLPQADTANKQITFDDIDNGTVAQVEVTGNVKIGNREQSLTNGSNRTVVTITFLGNMEKNPVITGINGENIEDLTINVRDVDSYTIDKLKEDIEAKVGDTDIKADVKVEILGGSIKKPEAGFAVVTRIKYSVITSTNKTAEVYRNITVTNYLPVIEWTTENLFLHKQVARITNTTELIDKLKEDVTISDFEDTNINDEKDTKLKMYLVKENEEIAIDNNFDLSDLNIGLNTIKYEVTDSNGNVVVAERQVRYQDNQYLIGLEDVIINSSQIAEYNAPNNMNGVSLVDPSAYTLTKQVTNSDGTTPAIITLPVAAEMPENPSTNPSEITGDGTAEYTIKYTITETNGTSTTQPIVQTRKVVVTNYMPKLSFENDTIEYYLGGKLDLTTGVSAIDYEDGDITSRVIMPQIDSTKLTEGEHTVTYTVVDSTGNTVTKERTLKVIGKEIKLEINNDISMENGEEVDVLEGVTVSKGDDFVLDIENNDVLGIKYALTDLSNRSIEEFATAEQVKNVLKTKEDGSYTLKYTVYFKDESIKTTIEKDREITISSIKILDPNLVKAINRQLGRTNLKSKITLEDLQSLTTLNAAGMDISYLTGLEYAVNLTNLNLQGNSKLSKADLSKLNKLKTINLSNTGIKDAKNIVLSTSAEIDKLYLSGNDIRTLNITLPNVKELDLSNSAILTVENIKASNLTSLKLNNNRITTINLSNISSGLTKLDLSENPKLNLSVTTLNRFNNLKSLNLENTGLKTIENLNLPELTDLRLGKNSIETINGLTVNKLEVLDLSGNKLSSISNINAGNLKNLNISNNKLTDVSFISGLKNLQRLDLSNNKIENLSFSGNLNNLISLNAKNNQITEVIGLNSDTLEELYLTGNDDLTILEDITLNNLETFEIGNTVKTLDNVVSENLNTSNFTQVTTITDCILPSLDLSGNVSAAKPISKGSKLKTITNSTVKTLPENTTLETIQDVTVMGNAVIDLSKAKIATLDGLTAETTTGLNVAGALEKIKNVNIKNGTNLDLTRATNLKSIESLTMKGSADFVLSDILANSPATKLEIVTGLTVSNSTTVNLSEVLKEGAVLKNISLPQATAIDLSNNNINLVEEISSITAPNLATLDLSNNNIIYIGNLETILGNITNGTPINVNLDNNKIKYISEVSNTGHNLTIADQQVDNLKAIVGDNNEMTVNPAELFKLPEEFDNITITANDGTVSGTGRATQITWNSVNEGAKKIFSFTATKTTRAGISIYGATVAVTAIGENTPILEMEDGTEAIKVATKDIEDYDLKYGIKYKIGNNPVDNLPDGYELKIYLENGNTETEVTNLTPPVQGENKIYNLVYKLVPIGGGDPTDILERKILTTNGMPTINTLRDIKVKKGAIIDLLDGVLATDLEDGNITEKIKVYVGDKLLANPKEYNTKDLSVGTHTVKYEVVDSDDNKKEVSRNVIILSNEKPILTVKSGDLSTKKGEIIDLLDGVSATDLEDGDITEKIKVSVNGNIVANPKEYDTKDLSVGTHTVKYEVVDSDKNESSIERKLKITTSGSGTGGSGGSSSGGGSSNPTTSTAVSTTNTVSKPTEDSETTNSLIDKINIPTIGEATPFKDVATNHWAKESIDRMSGAGIIKGDGKGNFKPTEKTTRADMTIMLVRLLGLESELATREFKGQFNDVRKDKYYAKYIELAKEYDLIKGVGENRFNPDSSIKREDAMVMVANILKELNIATPEGSTTIEYADKNQISGYAQESVEYLTKLGIIKGSNNLVKPKENLTRAEASQIINNVYNKLIEIQK